MKRMPNRREKFYVRKDGSVAAIEYHPREGRIMIGGNAITSGQYLAHITRVLFIKLEVSPRPDDSKGTLYKVRRYWKSDAEAWRVFKLNLEARGYGLEETASTGRLLR
jgi:hypothetical protein